jgi:hypothetical protein
LEDLAQVDITPCPPGVQLGPNGAWLPPPDNIELPLSADMLAEGVLPVGSQKAFSLPPFSLLFFFELGFVLNVCVCFFSCTRTL